LVDLDRVTSRLERVDWDFPGSGTSERSVHSTHWFPGNFIPQIPSALIEILSMPDDLVLDCFAGSGTTSIEASRLGRRAIASDALAACCVIAQGKSTIIRNPLARTSLDELFERLTFDHECQSDQIGARGEGASDVLIAWYSNSTLRQLRFLWGVVERANVELRPALELVFSDVLFACASAGNALTSSGGRRRHHWGWVADNVRPKQRVDHNAVALFRERLLFLRQLTIEDGTHSPVVVRQDARALSFANESIDLVVTSPPYIGVIDYAHANRLLYAWKNWSLAQDRNNEIGARYRRSRKNLVSEYLTDMRRVWAEIARVMRRGAYCAIVIGESRKFPGVVDQAMADLANELTLAWGPVERRPSRRRVSDRQARPAEEHILVFRKP
jgi:hypothetical protein